MSHVQYTTWRCDQLAEESARLHAALATASEQQNNARGNDIAGIIFLGVPVSSLSGDNVAPQIANYKGQIVAVSQAASHKGCTLPPPPPVQQTAKKDDEFQPF